MSKRPPSGRRAVHPWRRHMPVLVGGVVLVLAGAAAYWLITTYLLNASLPPPPREIQITLIRPPPEPPKPPEKPPEPEKVEEKLPEPIPQDQPPPAASDAPPPSPGLPDGPPGGMATDLGRGGGNWIGGGGDRQAWYGQRIARHLEDALRRSRRLQGTTYQVVAEIWFDERGAVQQVRLSRGSGNPDTDTLLREELLALPPMREPLPADLAQPVNVRVASRT